MEEVEVGRGRTEDEVELTRNIRDESGRQESTCLPAAVAVCKAKEVSSAKSGPLSLSNAPNTPQKTRSPLVLLEGSRSRITQQESSSMGELEATLVVS